MMNAKVACAVLVLVALLVSAIQIEQASGVTIASINFDGRTVSGNTANSLTWTTFGVNDPGSLTVVDEPPTGTLGGLFNTTDAQNRFVPDKNIQAEGPWSVSIPLTLTFPKLRLDGLTFDYLFYNNSGNFFTTDFRDTQYEATLTGSTSGLLASVNSGVQNSIVGDTVTLDFLSPIEMTSAETYTLKLLVSSPQVVGVNLGLDNLTINGDLVPIPEPSSALMLALGLCGLMKLRRRSR